MLSFRYGNHIIFRTYYTEVRLCDCHLQDCKGRFLTKQDSDQKVCHFELNRINYKNNIMPVMAIIEERITI